jgi:O-methyltransferase
MLDELKDVALAIAALPAKALRNSASRAFETLGLRDPAERLWWRLHSHWAPPVDLVHAAHFGPVLERIIAEQLARGAGAAAGDYLEFGVYNGRSMSIAYHAFTGAGLREARLVGFDSFDGMPGADYDDAGVFRRGQLYHDEKRTRAELRRNGVDLNRITLVKGWYDDTLNEATRRQLGLARLGIAMIDCVVYDSTCTVLRFIEPLIVDEAILIFDDWTCHDMHLKNQGQKRACEEWLGAHRDLVATEVASFEPHARVFRVERRR